MKNPPEYSSRKFQLAILLGMLAAFVLFGMFYRASSQGDSADTYPKGFRGGACTIETDTLIIGYSGYYLPADYEGSNDPMRSPYVPIQCGRVPEPAMLNISIDLLYPESAREFVFTQRLVKLEATPEQSIEREVLAIPAQQYRSGVITQAFKLDEAGQYVLYLNAVTPEHQIIQAHVPLKVGTDWQDHFRTLFSTFLRKE
ncbi:MAG: hypothetical protein LZF61_03865 [Nitrosomonas sp.]|nr:MAG: hypothetical protein LZF61_03865 [Nitrosomonas sp.]